MTCYLQSKIPANINRIIKEHSSDYQLMRSFILYDNVNANPKNADADKHIAIMLNMHVCITITTIANVVPIKEIITPRIE